jgi:alpha-tubulin suppressor-like RCC1 family protein
LYTCGDNSEGQLGLAVDYKTFNDKISIVTGIMDRVLSVSAGYRHTLILTERGSVYGMGSNRRSEMGIINNNASKFIAPVKIPSLDMFHILNVKAGSFSAALTSDQEILVWGTGEFGQIQIPTKFSAESIKFKDLSISKGKDSFGAAVDVDGFLYSWGDN